MRQRVRGVDDETGGQQRSGLRFEPDDRASVDSEGALAALDDADCRALLEATREEALTAGELVEHCDVPRSTTYRKLDRLVDVGLLEERIRISTTGKHTSEYRCLFEDLTVSLSSGSGVSVSVSQAVTAD